MGEKLFREMKAGSMKIFTIFILFVLGAAGENLLENYDRELSTIKLLFYPT